MLAALVLAFVQTPELSFDYRDDDDRRVLAEIVARTRGLRVEIEIRAHGPRVEPPRGTEGFRGENLQTSRELSRAGGDITAVTDGARAQGWSAPVFGPYRERIEEPARLAERPTPSGRVRSVAYWAELEEAVGTRPFRTEIRSAGVPRLVLRGVVDGPDLRLIGFEARPFAVRPRQESDAALIRRLSDESADVRREAEAMLRARGLAALPALEKHAEAADVELRARVRHLIHDIRLDDVRSRAAVGDPEARARALEDFGRAAGGDPLRLLADHPDARFAAALTDVLLFELDKDRRAGAREALQRLGPPAAYPGLIWDLRFPGGHLDQETEWLAAHGDATLLGELDRLSRLGYAPAGNAHSRLVARVGKTPRPPERWSPVDEAALRSAAREGKTPAERARGVRAVVTGLSRDAEAVAAVVAALADPDPEVRLRAAEAFAWLRSDAAVAPLAALLADPGAALKARQMAAVALGRHAAGDPLLAGFDAASPELRATIAGALGDTGRGDLRGAVEKRLAAEPDAAVREALRRAVTRLSNAKR